MADAETIKVLTEENRKLKSTLNMALNFLELDIELGISAPTATRQCAIKIARKLAPKQPPWPPLTASAKPKNRLDDLDNLSRFEAENIELDAAGFAWVGHGYWQRCRLIVGIDNHGCWYLKTDTKEIIVAGSWEKVLNAAIDVVAGEYNW